MVSNTPDNAGNLLELFFPPGKIGIMEIYSLLEIFWFSLRVCR